MPPLLAFPAVTLATARSALVYRSFGSSSVSRRFGHSLVVQPTRPRSLSAAVLESTKGTRDTAILFPGQGSQHVGMAADIYRDFPVAKNLIDECDDILGGGLREIMFNGPSDELKSTMNAQPAILCHSIAILNVLEHYFGFDISTCRYALGHSLGEYSALVATGALELKDALKLVRLRGIAMQSCVRGAETSMRAIVVSPDHLADIEQEILGLQKSMPKGEVAQIANINSRSQIVLSGTTSGVEYAGMVVHKKGFAGRSLELPVSAPFHCSLMSPAAIVMEPALESSSFQQPIIDVISNVTAKPYESPADIVRLLKGQITQTVQWERSLRHAKEHSNVSKWIVIGPLRVLSNLLRKDFPNDSIRPVWTSEEIKAWGQ